MTLKRDVLIVSAVRTPIGSYGGTLAPLKATELGSIAIRTARERVNLPAEAVGQVIMGNVLSAGLGQAPARQAAIYSGLPNSVPCLTINKMCGSGLKAVMLAGQAIALEDSETAIAGGMESMSNAPYLLDKARFGYRMGHGEIVDSMIKDGLWDVYNDFHMGNAAELCAVECGLSREDQDAFAVESYKRAINAGKAGHFKDEIVPVTITSRKGDMIVDTDEEPERVKFEKIPALRPVFKKDGTITAANASTINDGASALVLMSSGAARKHDITPMARVIAYASAARAPEWFTIAPVDAMQNALQKANMAADAIDLFEINEAFSVVTMAASQRLKLDPNRTNISGGAVALGHPIGASGARILTTLLHNLKRTGGKYGMASLCIGGGEAVAVIVELMS